MLFEIVRHNFPRLKRVDSPSGRVYLTPEGNSYPSVTSVLAGVKPNEFLEAWKQRVGEEAAKRISEKATKRGTELHSYVENYLQGVPFSVNLTNAEMWAPIKKYLTATITEVHAIESSMYSNHLRSAGTVDLIARHNGKLAIVDIKTSSRIKYEEDIPHYFEQCAAYAVMFEELFGISVPNLVIIMGCDESVEPLIFNSKRDKHIDSYIQKRKEYEEALGL